MMGLPKHTKNTNTTPANLGEIREESLNLYNLYECYRIRFSPFTTSVTFTFII